MGKINGLNIKRKANLTSINDRERYDMIELHSRNIFNSEKVLNTNQDFSLFLDIVGTNNRNIGKLFINYHLINPNSIKAEEVKNKVNGIYEDLIDGIDKLDMATDSDLGIKFTIKREDDKLAVVQSYNKYELDKHYISKADEIYSSLSNFKTNREDIGKIIKDKLDKEYNVVREMVDGGEENTEYRIKDTYLPKINKTVFVIDKKRMDFNENREKEEYWETVDMYTDIEALGSLSMMKSKNLIKNKKLELKKNLEETDFEKIINILENPKIQKLLNDKDYYTFDFTSDGKEKPVGLNKNGIQKFGEKSANVGIFASFLILSAFRDKNIKNKNGEYEFDEKVLNKNTILVKRALNVASEYEKTNKDIEEFMKTPKSNLVNISAMSLSEIEIYERGQMLSPEIRQRLAERKDFLEKYSIVDGLLNDDGEKTDHIENLNELEVLIDLYDGNTSPEQRRLLELKLLEYAKKHKEEQEEIAKEINQIMNNTKENALLFASAGLVLGTIQELSGNGNRIDNELEKSTKKYSKVFDMKEFNKEETQKEKEKERLKSEALLKLLLSVRYAEYEDEKENLRLINEKSDFSKSDENEDKNDIEKSKLKRLGEAGKKIGMFTLGSGYMEKNSDFDEQKVKEHNEEFLKINKAMAIANQNRIDYNMAKTKATVMNISPSGDVFVEMQLLKNSPERIYNDGMSVLSMDKTEPVNIVDKLIKENKNSDKENKNSVEQKLSDKVIEKELKNVPSSDINQKIETTFNELQRDIIEKDLKQKETYKAIENIVKEKETLVDKDKTKENIAEIDMRTEEVVKEKENLTEKVRVEEDKVEEKVEKSPTPSKATEWVDEKDEWVDDEKKSYDERDFF
jgi:hypothetical protein